MKRTNGSIASLHTCTSACTHDPLLAAIYQDWFGISSSNEGLRAMVLNMRDKVARHEWMLKLLGALAVSGGSAAAIWQTVLN